MIMLRLKNIQKNYFSGDRSIPILQGIDLNIRPGSLVSIMGPSGAGKSTLLHIMGLLDLDFQGRYWINGQQINRLSETKAAHLRNQFIGFIFQSFHLIPFKTALENVALPLYYQKVARRKRLQIALEYLDRVGLKKRASHHPAQLSGGEQQRVAIARAMITNPRIILADEPTGALDSKTSNEIMTLFKKMNSSEIAIVVITHEKEIAAQCDRIINLRDGRIISEEAEFKLKLG
jgi:putative ABC transport system ATP-binding protein